MCGIYRKGDIGEGSASIYMYSIVSLNLAIKTGQKAR